MDEGGPITIYIRTLTGSTRSCNVDSSTVSVVGLKEKIQDMEGIPPGNSRRGF